MEGVLEGGGGRRLSIDGNLASELLGVPGGGNALQRQRGAQQSTAEHSTSLGGRTG